MRSLLAVVLAVLFLVTVPFARATVTDTGVMNLLVAPGTQGPCAVFQVGTVNQTFAIPTSDANYKDEFKLLRAAEQHRLPLTFIDAGSTVSNCQGYELAQNIRLGMGSSTTCPQGSGFPDDGCPAAPVCTPGSATCYQQSNFFTAYTSAGNISAHRPPWNVAGVDYPVGVNDSCIASGLKNPATTPPAGTNYSSGTLNVTGANVTIDCYDMTNTSVSAASGSGTLTVSNNKFDNENRVFCPYNPSHALNMVVQYNTFHGATGDGGFTAFIYYACSGNVTSAYNYFHTSSKDFMEFAPQTLGNIALLQFNFGQCLAAAASNHGQPNEDYGIQSGTTKQLFNTFYDDGCQSITGGSSGVTALCEFDPEGPDINPICNNNTMVDTFGDADVIEMCSAGPGGGNCHSGDTSTSLGVQGTVTINSNYILYTKAPYYTAPHSGSGVTSTVTSGNINLLTGAACNAYAGAC